MYKLLLSWRYLLTRYIALASVVSMTLGVATMIIVNAVMLGFTSEMQKRIQGMSSDIIFEAATLDAIPNPDAHIRKIRQVAGDQIEGISPTVITFALLSYRIGDEYRTQQVQLIGIDCDTQGSVSDMQKYLQHPENRERLSFLLKKNGYDRISSQKSSIPYIREDLGNAGWDYRRTIFARIDRIRKQNDEFRRRQEEAERKKREEQIETPQLLDWEELWERGDFGDFDGMQQVSIDSDFLEEINPYDLDETSPLRNFDPTENQHTGIIIGIGLTCVSREEVVDEKTGKRFMEDILLVRPGDNVTLMFPTVGRNPKVRQDVFTIVDIMETRMTEHDDRLVFIPIEHLQKLRGMIDPATGMKSATQLLIKAKPGANLDELKRTIQKEFANYYPVMYQVQTWKDTQASLLSAVSTEVAILNVLLFLIFAVAGFGILAIFFMIVVEKTKDIGILKSLGASGGGIMQIFLVYSLSLGLVGSGIGIVLGLLFVAYIKEIAEVLSWFMGHSVFDPKIYSFSEIPTIVEPATVFWIVFGAIFIAVCSGVLPALRAARLKPVEALRK